MIMKKFITSIIIVLLLAIVTSCGSGKTEVSDKSTESKNIETKNTENKSVESKSTETKTEEVPPIDYGKKVGNNFESEWLNMKFVVPENIMIVTPDEFQSKLGVSPDKLELDYSFFAVDPMGTINIQLAYDEVSNKMTAEKYMQNKKDQFSKKYEFVEEGTRELAGKEFYYLKYALNDKGTVQEHYFYKQGDYIVTIVCSYIEPAEENKEEFLNGITTLK